MNSHAAPQRSIFTGRKMLAIMVAFFGTVFVVNFYFAYAAIHTFTGLVVDDSYQAGQTFDKDTAKVVADEARDIHPQLSYASGVVTLKLVTAAGAPVAANTLHLTLGHPVSAATDRALTFTAIGDGTFTAPAALNAGDWEGKLETELADGTRWSRMVKIWVK